MASARLARIAFYLLSAFAMWAGHEAFAESSPLLATFTRPAVFVAARAAPAEGGEAALPRRAHVIIGVTEYHPADDGTPVEVVVKGRVGGGAEREVGRFAVTPDRDFKAAEPSEALRFSLLLPGELTTSAPVAFSVQLVPGDPTAGEARDKGAYLRVGEAEIR
jgi:hypothetical protein